MAPLENSLTPHRSCTPASRSLTQKCHSKIHDRCLPCPTIIPQLSPNKSLSSCNRAQQVLVVPQPRPTTQSFKNENRDPKSYGHSLITMVTYGNSGLVGGSLGRTGAPQSLGCYLIHSTPRLTEGIIKGVMKVCKLTLHPE